MPHDFPTPAPARVQPNPSRFIFYLPAPVRLKMIFIASVSKTLCLSSHDLIVVLWGALLRGNWGQGGVRRMKQVPSPIVLCSRTFWHGAARCLSNCNNHCQGRFVGGRQPYRLIEKRLYSGVKRAPLNAGVEIEQEVFRQGVKTEPVFTAISGHLVVISAKDNLPKFSRQRIVAGKKSKSLWH